MTHQILRLPEVVNRTGVPRSTLYAKVAEGETARANMERLSSREQPGEPAAEEHPKERHPKEDPAPMEEETDAQDKERHRVGEQMRWPCVEKRRAEDPCETCALPREDPPAAQVKDPAHGAHSPESEDHPCEQASVCAESLSPITLSDLHTHLLLLKLSSVSVFCLYRMIRLRGALS